MKRIKTDDKTSVRGFYIRSLERGFMGERGEGNKMLEAMGLPKDTIPFSSASLLRNAYAFWNDSQGNRVWISFKLKHNQMECFGSYLGKEKSIRLFREWSDYEDSETIARLESEAIGDLCMRCIYENLEID